MTTIDMQALGEAAERAAEGVAVGDTVICWDTDGGVTYGGPDDHGSNFVMVIGVGTGGMTVKCPVGRVAPADTPLADAKDPRIEIVKGRGPSGRNSGWVLHLGGDTRRTWHERKRDAVAAGQRRLAIIDWHAARGEFTVGGAE